MKIEEVKRRIAQVHGTTITIDESSYEGFKKHAFFIDVEHGKWHAFVYSVCRGSTHPDRAAIKRRISLKEAQHRIQEKHAGIVSIKADSWVCAKARCMFVDKDYGEWEAFYNNVVRGMQHPARALAQRARKNTYALEDIQQIIDEKHLGIVKVKGPYTGISKKCLFEDVEFGEFVALPLNVIRGSGHIKRAVQKRRATSFIKYGGEHPMQCNAVFLKNIRSQRKHLKCPHWKTGEILNCINMWEFATVKWFNKNKIDFLWQPKAFKMPDGRTYRPDAYIVDWNLWIDIKGYYREQSRIKCEWFKSVMPNFELWFKDKLLSFGIL